MTVIIQIVECLGTLTLQVLEIEGSKSRTNDGERPSGGKNQFMCYKCNKPRHIARNYKAPKSQNGTNLRRNAPICQLCNNFIHTIKYSRMDKSSFNMNLN